MTTKFEREAGRRLTAVEGDDYRVEPALTEARIEEFNSVHDAKGRFGSKVGGPAPQAGVAAVLDKVEPEIAKITGGEKAVVIGPDGSVILTKTQMGDPDGPGGPAIAGVDFTDAELARLSGTTFTHNHPGWEEGGKHYYDSLSIDDVGMSAKHGVAEVRAVTPDGHFYSMKPGPDGWGTDAKIGPVVNRSIASVTDDFYRNIRLGAKGWPKTQEARRLYAEAHHWDEVWRRAAPQLGWTYTSGTR